MVKRPTLAMLALLSACTTPRTEILVVTDTDLSVPDELDEMIVEVTGPGGDVQSSIARFGPGQLPPPRVLGLVNDGGRLGPYLVRVRGLQAGGDVVERRAEVDFQAQRTLVLRITLSRSCIGRTCGTGETCAGGACRPIELDPSELEEWQGDIPIPSSDAGVGPQLDAGAVVDAGSGCAAEQCNGRDDDCDGDVDEDFDVTSDPSHCGTCGNACSIANGTPACIAGACRIDACDAGFDDCDGQASNGCESDLDRPATCGSCTNACRPPNRNCCDGSCC